MAKDSDFYIFDIEHGYIPFQQYSISGSNTTVKKFSFDGFARHLGIEPSMLPLLASLAGNDYISNEELEPFDAHIKELVSSSNLDAGGNKFVNIAQFFLSKYESIPEATHAVKDLYGHGSAFEEKLDLSIKEYQMKQSNYNYNLISYFDSGDLRCNMRTYKNKHSLPEWIVKLYREGLLATEGLDCLCNRTIFLRTQCEDISLPSAQICAQDLRWYYYVLALNCEDTVVPPEDIIVTEYDREEPKLAQEESKLVKEEVNLTRKVPNIKIKIHDIPKMPDQEKKSHLLSLLHFDLRFIHHLPIKHQLVVSALRYWFIHAQVKPVHLAALLVQYVDEKPGSSGFSGSSPHEREIYDSSSNKWLTITINSQEVFLEAVHGFSQWQNVLYWVKQLNALFSYTFPQLQVAKLYNCTLACLVYRRLKYEG